jgi:Na+/H+ antiporter NhaA
MGIYQDIQFYSDVINQYWIHIHCGFKITKQMGIFLMMVMFTESKTSKKPLDLCCERLFANNPADFF